MKTTKPTTAVFAAVTLWCSSLVPALAAMHGRRWEAGVVRAASLGVAAAGLFWLAERLFWV